MSMTTPLVPNSLIPFPADEDYVFNFNVVEGSQVVKNELEIRDNIDTQVYLNNVESFQFRHTIPASTLTNGTQYKLRVRTFDISDNSSSWSDWVIFYCFALPEVGITNIPEGIVNNQTYTFEGLYSQVDGEELQSYRFLLYNKNSVLLQSYPEKFGEPISQEIAGLQNDTNYKIELRVITVNGMEATTGLVSFLAQYIQPQLATIIRLENLQSQASVKVALNIIEAIGEIESGSIDYIESDWIDLHSGKIYFQNGLIFKNNNWKLDIWARNIIPEEKFITVVAQQGKIDLVLEGDGRIHVYKYLNRTDFSYHIYSDELTIADGNDVLYICLKHINNLCDIRAEVLD